MKTDLHSLSLESTDNAFVKGIGVQASPRVAGQVVRALVTDNEVFLDCLLIIVGVLLLVFFLP